MKKIMLAVAAIVAVSSLSLVSCGSNPADKAQAALDTYNKEMETANGDVEKEAKATAEFTMAVDEAYKACKNAEDSAAVDKVVAAAAITPADKIVKQLNEAAKQLENVKSYDEAREISDKLFSAIYKLQEESEGFMPTPAQMVDMQEAEQAFRAAYEKAYDKFNE